MADSDVSMDPPQFAMFPTNQEVLSFLLMNMKDSAELGPTHTLTSLDHTKPSSKPLRDLNWNSWQHLATLTPQGPPSGKSPPHQSGTCVDYITKPPLGGQPTDSNPQAPPITLLELQNAALVINNALRKERASHRQGTVSLANHPTRKGDKYRPANYRFKEALQQPQLCIGGRAKPLPRRWRCIKCGKMGHKFAECRMGWKATPIEDKGKAKETAKIGKDSKYQLGKEISPLFTILIKPEKQAEQLEVLIDSGATLSFLHPCTAKALRLPLIDLPTPHTVTMLNGDQMVGNAQPKINWNLQTLSFPHNPPEHVAIAKEEEADPNPLEGVPSKYHQYAKVFGEEEFNKLPPHRHYDIRIELTEEGPLNLPLYSMTDAESITLKDWLRDKLKAGKIRPSKSSISSPVMFVPKKDGSRCLVVDYCCLNNQTKKNVYPLPCPDDLMAQLCGAKDGDKWKTAFRTKYGLYKSLVMTFGLTNAPTAFQHFMNELFKDLLDVCVIIYLDDILIYSKDDASHAQHVHKVLKRLMDNQLFCKASKFWISSKSRQYKNGRYPKVKEVQLFLGFANFLRQFVANFSHLARPLHNLVKKDTIWKWDTKEQEAFQGLKDAITNAPVLCHADPTKPYFLETDASSAALGSILSQQQEDSCLHPLGFLLESFKGAEQNYDTHNKELLAIIRSFEYWRIFLEGTAHPITVFTNHQNLEYWKESQTFNRRHARWHLLLAGYNFQIVYRPGKQSGKPDALSQQADHADIPPEPQSMLPDPVFANIALVTPEKELQQQIESSLDQDKSLEEILQFLQNKSKAPPSIKRAFKDYEMEAGLLFYQGQIVVPDIRTLRTDLLRIFHNSPLAGHLGRQRTLELVSRSYYWPGICADTYWHVDSCKICQWIRKPKYASIPLSPLKPTKGQEQQLNPSNCQQLHKVRDICKMLQETQGTQVSGTIPGECMEAPWHAEKTISTEEEFSTTSSYKLCTNALALIHFSSAYHPQSDRQTEHVNPSIEHFLRAYSGVNQKDWTRWLPMAEFAYNNAVHSSTGKTPFKALYGWEPTLTLSNVPTDVPEADNLAQTMEAQWKEVELALQQSKQQMIARESGSPTEFETGEEAWLDAKNINLKTLSSKLTEQRLGPFKVIEKISNRAYRLELPPTMRIHNIFYVGLLSKVKRDKKRAFENCPPPVTVDREEEYKVEGITNAEERNGKWFFQVKWKGYRSKENTWEPQENLKNAKIFLQKYKKDMKKKALGAAKALRGGQC
ncbi:hypothetical protein RHS01_00264 [Rhizoctonia solani]|uniref:Reverse transcriptase n=1 Tax=Rhizoctonia solani TaxID=456999 RepID=A0A8H7INN7_9AGAM|nr:hypothetical protein RHS01_00264 [Rhizoctonia solani]